MGILSVQDVPAKVVAKFDAALLQKLVDGLNGRVARIAPCIESADAGARAEALLILLGAITRWSEAGTGVLQQGQAGQFGYSVDTRQGNNGYVLRDYEENALRDLCDTGETPGQRVFSFRPTYQPDPPQQGVTRW